VKIALIGATGFVGSALRDEALNREHEVTAIVRHPEKLPVHVGLTAKKTDVLDIDSLAKILAGHDAVISAFSADRDSVTKFEDHVAGAKAIIAATKKAGVKRLLVVGGAASLEVAPGRQLYDQPDFPPRMEGWSGGHARVPPPTTQGTGSGLDLS